MKKCSGIVNVLLTVLLGVSLCSCSKSKSAREEIEEYLNSIQDDPSSFTKDLKMNSEYQTVLDELIKEYEYVITKEEDDEANGETKSKTFYVDFKGYDIGTYFKKYLDTFTEGALAELLKEFSLDELQEMYQNDPYHYTELFTEADLAYYKEVMKQCKDAGKTYLAEGKYGIIVYWYDSTKKWSPSILSKDRHLDFITNNLSSIWKEYKKEAEYPKDKTVVGRDILAEDITDFSFTYEESDSLTYQIYRFYMEEGKYIFFHERKENDTISTGTIELTQEQWNSFFSWIKGGTIERYEVPGYTISISWNDNEDHPYSFPSFGAITAFQMKSYNLAHQDE